MNPLVKQGFGNTESLLHFFIVLRKFFIEANYSINSFLGVCSLRKTLLISCEEKKKYTFRRLDNVIQIGYDARFGFGGYTIVS